MVDYAHTFGTIHVAVIWAPLTRDRLLRCDGLLPVVYLKMLWNDGLHPFRFRAVLQWSNILLKSKDVL